MGGVKIGGKEKVVIMPARAPLRGGTHPGYCQSREGGRGPAAARGAYKPRTSPYAFQGLGTEGIQCMVKAKEVFGLPIVSELMSENKLAEFEEYVDLIQVGARNMQNFELLKALGKSSKPVLLKRGLSQHHGRMDHGGGVHHGWRQ